MAQAPATKHAVRTHLHHRWSQLDPKNTMFERWSMTLTRQRLKQA